MLTSLWLAGGACTSSQDSGDAPQPDSGEETADSGTTDTDTDSDPPPPPQVARLAVAAGDDHTCVLERPAGSATVDVVCLGRTDHGRDTPPAAADFSALSAAASTTCAWGSGQPACWGQDPARPHALGALPDTLTAPPSLGPVHGCGLADTSVVCWGDDSLGQTNPPNLTRPWQKVAAGQRHSCGLTNGEIVCWGDTAGALGAEPPGQFVAIAAGRRHACAVSSAAGLVCWGDDSAGQSSPPSDELFRDVVARGDHSCGLRTDGFVRCWGDNTWGQTSAPTHLVFRTIATGARHSCGITEDEALVCWGYAPAWAEAL